ncbi:bpX5 domain-containing protein [Embleya sp. NPDC001921]
MRAPGRMNPAGPAEGIGPRDPAGPAPATASGPRDEPFDEPFAAGPAAPAWHPREPPLPVAAVLARGSAVPSLALRVVERLERGDVLRAVGDRDWLVVVGEDLPRPDGLRYLGWDGEALTPTTMRPAPSAELWRLALGSRDLVVLLPDGVLVAPMPAGAADRDAPATLAAGGGR